MWAAPGGGLVRGYDNAQTGIYSLPNRGVAMFKDSPAQAPAFCQQLQRELLQYSYGSVRFENIDVSTVAWDQAQLCQMFDLLRDAGASSQRIKAYRVGATDASMRSLCEWLMCTDARKMPQEIHLSHNELTTESLQVLLTVLEVKQMDCQPSFPCWIRIEGNLISAEYVSGLGKDGLACLAEGKCNTRFCELQKHPSQLPRLVHLRYGVNQKTPKQPLGLQGTSSFFAAMQGKSTVVDHLVNLKAMALQLRGRDATADPQSYDKEALQVQQARQVVSTAASKACAEAALEWQARCQRMQAELQQQQYEQYQQAAAQQQQQQMLHAQQIQAQQQAQQLQFQQMQAQQWQYQVQAAQAQQMAQQPAPQAAAQASDPVPAKPQETKDTATDLLRAGAAKAVEAARIASEGQTEETKEAPESEADPEVERALNKARAQVAAQEIEQKLAKDAEEREAQEAKAPKQEPSPPPQAPATEPPPEAVEPAKGQPGGQSGSTAVSSKRSDRDDATRSETKVARQKSEGSGANTARGVRRPRRSSSDSSRRRRRRRYSPPRRRRRARRASSSTSRRRHTRRPRHTRQRAKTSSSSSSSKPTTKPKGKAKPKSKPDPAPWTGKAKSPSPTAAKTAADGGQSSSVPESPATVQLTEDQEFELLQQQRKKELEEIEASAAALLSQLM